MSEKKVVQTIRIKTDEENPVDVELIAEAIIQVAESFEKINDSQLSRRAIVLLLQDMIGVGRIGKQQIELVLDNAARLKEYYIKKKK